MGTLSTSLVPDAASSIEACTDHVNEWTWLSQGWTRMSAKAQEPISGSEVMVFVPTVCNSQQATKAEEFSGRVHAITCIGARV